MAIAAFRRLYALGDSSALERRLRGLESLTVRSAEYDFRQLYDWYMQMQDAVWSLPGIAWTDIDERKNRIEVGFSEDAQFEAVASMLDDLAVPPGAVVVLQNSGRVEATANLRGSVTQKVGGVQVDVAGDPDPCSLGFFVDRAADAYWYFVTASHCTSDFVHLDGDTIGQPTSGSVMGYEVSDPAGFTHATDAACPTGKTCRRSDVALFRATMWSFYQGHVAWPSIGDTLYTGSVPLYSAFDTEVGDSVHFVGKQSGRLVGEVVDTCVNLDPYLETGFALICVWEADYQPVSGDSGGSVVWVDPGDEDFKVAAGVNFARRTANGNGLFSATTQWTYEIQQDYGGTYCLDVWCAPDPVVSIGSGPSTVPNTSVWCEWEATVTRGVPPYTFTWSGVASGTGSILFAPVTGSGNLFVEVEDGVGNVDTAWLYVTIDSGADPPECSEQ